MVLSCLLDNFSHIDRIDESSTFFKEMLSFRIGPDIFFTGRVNDELHISQLCSATSVTLVRNSFKISLVLY